MTPEQEADIVRAYELGFTLDFWGRWVMPGEWRLPPGHDEGTRGLNAAGMTEEQVREHFDLAFRLDAYGPAQPAQTNATRKP